MIKAVLFDFGGVLTSSGKRGFIGSIMGELYGQSPEDMGLWELNPSLRNGSRSETEFFEILNKRFGKNVTPEAFLERSNSLLVPAQQVYDLAAQLTELGIRTGILSNVFGFNARELRRRGCYDGFDPVILSCEEGYIKPDPKLYEIAVQRLELQPKEIVFIDDQEQCLQPARQMGMHTVLAQSPDQTVADTKTLLQRNGVDI